MNWKERCKLLFQCKVKKIKNKGVGKSPQSLRSSETAMVTRKTVLRNLINEDIKCKGSTVEMYRPKPDWLIRWKDGCKIRKDPSEPETERERERERLSSGNGWHLFQRWLVKGSVCAWPRVCVCVNQDLIDRKIKAHIWGPLFSQERPSRMSLVSSVCPGFRVPGSRLARAPHGARAVWDGSYLLDIHYQTLFAPFICSSPQHSA